MPLVAELAELRVRIGVQAEVLAEALAVERPAFNERRVADVLAKLRRTFHFLRQRNLQMVAGDSFVERERLHFPLGPRVKIVGVDKIAAGTAGLRRAGLIVGSGLRRRLEIGNRANAVGQARELAKKMRQPGIDALGDNAVAVHQVVGLVVVETRIGAQKFREVVEAALKLGRRDDFVHFGADAFHFREADFVNLLGREIRRSLPADQERVGSGAVRQCSGRDAFATCGKIRGGHVIVEFAERRRKGSRVDAFGFFGEAGAVSLGKIGREFGERLQQRAGERIGGSDIGDLLGQVA